MSLLSITPPQAPALYRPVHALTRQFRAALAARRSRRQLSQLEAHLLEDIGVSRKSAKIEANRPIWDVPAHWIE